MHPRVPAGGEVFGLAVLRARSHLQRQPSPELFLDTANRLLERKLGSANRLLK